MWGWAFLRVGAPWVAHRVWPTPALPRHAVRGQRGLEIGDLAGLAPAHDSGLVENRDAGRIVAAILETAQSVEENRNRLDAAKIADDPAHDPSASAA